MTHHPYSPLNAHEQKVARRTRTLRILAIVAACLMLGGALYCGHAVDNVDGSRTPWEAYTFIAFALVAVGVVVFWRPRR